MDRKEPSAAQRKVTEITSGIMAGSAIGCMVGGSVLIVVIVLVGLVRLLGWLVGL